MSTESVLEELHRKKRCIERAIRELERVQQLEGNGDPKSGQPLYLRSTGASNLLVMRYKP